MLIRTNFAAKVDGDYVALISIDFPYPNSSNFYWMGVLKRYHRQGIGRMLLAKAMEYAYSHGVHNITVETVAPQECDENYLKTYLFYCANGFRPLFNLKPAGYEWNMVYMHRHLSSLQSSCSKDIQITTLCHNHIKELVDGFARHNWEKPTSLFESYLKEQNEGKRQIWVAVFEQKVAGYVTLNWYSRYQSFSANQIPEIMDLNVLPPFRRKGIGSKLLDTAENEAMQKSDIVGIGVGLYDGYGDAQKLYVQRGYLPNGHGITYNYAPVQYGQSVVLDDDLVLWFTKNIKTVSRL